MSNINSNDDQVQTTKLETISKIIGEEYKEWDNGNYIFINASTGTGKTYFIIEDLYEYANTNDFQIVMLVNRSILKDQIIFQIKDLEIRKDIESKIKIFTYQEIECADDKGQWKIDYINKCRYIVCDEAHYFLQDATFNPQTQKSFYLIMNLVPKSIVIFMTATSKEICAYIEKEQANLYNKRHDKWMRVEEKNKKYNEKVESEYCDFNPDTGEEYNLNKKIKKLKKFPESFEARNLLIKPSPEPQEVHLIQYSLFRDISNRLNVKLFRNIHELVDTICSNRNNKWLIFVNTKKTGKQLYQDLRQKGISKDDVIFINADYRKYGQEKEKEEVSYLTKHQYSKTKILICTSVLQHFTTFCFF